MEMELREKMVQFRALHNLSQKALADMCGVTLQTINAVENGTQTPSKLTQTKIMLVIGKEV